jgi:GNAT superfamily N-acetyltransferase
VTAISYRTIPHSSLNEKEKRDIGKLIISCFPKAEEFYSKEMMERLRTYAWRTVIPSFHCLAYSDDQEEPVAQQSVFHLLAGNLEVYGLGDMVVEERFRYQGLARKLVGMAIEEAQQEKAEVICTRTTKLASVFSQKEFVLDEEGRFFVAENGEKIAHLWVRLARDIKPERLILAPSDF